MVCNSNFREQKERKKTPIGELNVFRPNFWLLWKHLTFNSKFSQLLFHATRISSWLLRPVKVFELFGTTLLLLTFVLSFLSLHSQWGYHWYHSCYYAVSVLLKGRHAAPVFARCFPSPFPRRKRASSEIASILKVCLYSHA